MAAINNDWLDALKGEFSKPYYKKLFETVNQEYRTHRVYPCLLYTSILYLIGRRKYPVQNMSIEDQEKIETRKKAAGAALVFMTLGAIGFVINIMRIYI